MAKNYYPQYHSIYEQIWPLKYLQDLFLLTHQDLPSPPPRDGQDDEFNHNNPAPHIPSVPSPVADSRKKQGPPVPANRPSIRNSPLPETPTATSPPQQQQSAPQQKAQPPISNKPSSKTKSKVKG